MKAGGERNHTVPLREKRSPREHASPVVAGRGHLCPVLFSAGSGSPLARLVPEQPVFSDPALGRAPFPGNSGGRVGQSENTEWPTEPRVGRGPAKPEGMKGEQRRGLLEGKYSEQWQPLSHV